MSRPSAEKAPGHYDGDGCTFPDPRHFADYDAATLEPWGPFEMGGFEGCTDQSPDLCACATDRQPTCENCGQEIEPGEQAWARRWPCYNTLPLGHPDQEWDVISWHDECPDARVTSPETTPS